MLLSILTAAAPTCLAQTTSKPLPAGSLKNNPAREAKFMDWGLGMFVHWSLDSQLGSVISHSMEYASQKYLDRYIHELPKTFNPDQYDPDKWMEIAKLAGVKYMVFTVKHHSGFCMWDTKTTDFSIMHTPYGKDIVCSFVDACRRHDIKIGFYYSPEDGRYVYAFLTKFTDDDPGGTNQWGRMSRKEILLRGLKATPNTKITVLGQEDRVERFTSRHDIGSRIAQKEEGLEISVVRAQRLYNNGSWPNAVVVRLENVEFANK